MSGRLSNEAKAAATGNGARWTSRAVLGAVCAVVVGIYAWSARSGLMELLGSGARDSAYNLLVRGFGDGQLNLEREVPPGLGDPPNVEMLNNSGLDDLSYYKGKLYLYFGVTPALALFWPYAALTGHYLLHKDAAVIFFAVGFLAGAGLLWAVRRRYFPEASVWTAAAGALALGLANLAPVILARCDVYEVAISCGYGLAMLALAGVWAALRDGRRRGRWLAAASLAYGMALGARPSLLFGAVILLVPLAQAWREKRPVWRLLPAAGGPIGLIGLGLMIYNALRFDNPLEFGEDYQLPITPHQLFRLRYIWFNLRTGFLEPARWSGRFPFVHDIAPLAMPGGYHQVEHPFGVLTNVPLVWLALAAPLAWRSRSVEDRRLLRCFLGAVALFFGMCALPLLIHDSMCLRYETEYVSPLVLLAVMGVFALERVLAGQPVRRRAARCGWIMLLAYSVAFNVLERLELQGDAQNNVGAALLQKGGVEEAMVHLQRALEINPAQEEARNNLGLALYSKGELDPAIAQFRQALQIQPQDFQAHNNLGVALYAKGDLDEAVTHYRQALQIKPDYAQARNNLGHALEMKGDLEGAIAEYRKALETEPAYADARNNLGNALAREGKLEEAAVQYGKALEANPGLAEAQNNLGVILFRQARVEEALAHYQKAVALQPGYGEALNNLATASMRLGRMSEAISAYRKALDLTPENAETLNNLAWALATCPQAPPRDGAAALALARKAVQLTGEQNPTPLRTLAAAEAETGSYGLAAVTARRALGMATEQKNEALAAALQKEIALYEAGAPMREGATPGVAPGVAP
jgi:tetratricopeptide (TPR) repeat protein